MLDVDGTLVPYDYTAVPSDAVIQAIKKAQEKVTICLVTGRHYGFLEDIFNKLDIHSGFAVLNNGSQVMDLSTKQLIYDQPLSSKDAEKIIEILFQEEISFYIKDDILKNILIENILRKDK
jgi:HAD superfamily hydrolase (TIGR01484 family)